MLLFPLSTPSTKPSLAVKTPPTFQQLAIAGLGEGLVHHAVDAVGGVWILGGSGEDGPADEDFPPGITLTLLGIEAMLDAAHLVAKGGNLALLDDLELSALLAEQLL